MAGSLFIYMFKLNPEPSLSPPARPLHRWGPNCRVLQAPAVLKKAAVLARTVQYSQYSARVDNGPRVQ